VRAINLIAKWFVLVSLVVILGQAPSIYAQDACLSAGEALNFVREKLALSPTPRDLDEAYQRMRFATDNCPNNGDGWYYRHLLAQKLNKTKEEIVRSLAQAERYESLALQQRENPFIAPAPQGTAKSDLLPNVREKWALVVGISRFKYNPDKNLKYAAKDAQDFADVLCDEKYGRFKSNNVKVILNEEATLENIRTGLGWLRENAKKEDLVIIYFSSHGSPREMDPSGVSFIVAHDTTLESKAKLFATSLEMIYLVHIINQGIKAQRTVLFLDTCFSGDAVQKTGAKSLDSEPEKRSSDIGTYSGALKALRSGMGRAVIASSRADQVSWEDNVFRNSIFTYHLLEALRQESGTHKLDQIFAYVSRQVSASAEKKGHTQTPVMDKSDKAGEIIIGVVPSSAQAPRDAKPSVAQNLSESRISPDDNFKFRNNVQVSKWRHRRHLLK
jgi:hypothetical protein